MAYCEALGHLEIERRRPVTPDSVWRIYSMTKPITSVGLTMLYEQGRFQLEDPVHRFIPSWKNLGVFVNGDPSRVRDGAARAGHDDPICSATPRGRPTGSWSAATWTRLSQAGRGERAKAGYTLRDMIATLAELPA